MLIILAVRLFVDKKIPEILITSSSYNYKDQSIEKSKLYYLTQGAIYLTFSDNIVILLIYDILEMLYYSINPTDTKDILKFYEMYLSYIKSKNKIINAFTILELKNEKKNKVINYHNQKMEFNKISQKITLDVDSFIEEKLSTS